MTLGRVYGGGKQKPDGSQVVQLGDGPQLDAFDRLRVSNPTGLFESTMTYDAQPLLWNQKLTATGTATYVQDESAVRMTVAAQNDVVERQTKSFFRYQPGRSQLVYMTYNFGQGSASVRKRVGYFDSENGIFLEEINGSLWIVKRSNVTGTPVDTRIAQADWNLDKYSELDPTKAQLFAIDMEWLGVGRVRVGFIIDGQLRYAHEFLEQNARETVYMSTAQLPVYLTIEAISTLTTSNSMTAICAAVMSEGGQDTNVGFPFSTRTGDSLVAVDGTRIPVLSIRPKATFNGRVNRTLLTRGLIEILNDAAIAIVDVIYDGVLTAGSFASVDDESTTEVDTSATAVTGGIVIRSFMVGATNQANNTGGVDLTGRLPLALDIDGANPTNLTIAITNIGGAASVLGAVSWQEYR
jgi:hypothetical protein